MYYCISCHMYGQFSHVWTILCLRKKWYFTNLKSGHLGIFPYTNHHCNEVTVRADIIYPNMCIVIVYNIHYIKKIWICMICIIVSLLAFAPWYWTSGRYSFAFMIWCHPTFPAATKRCSIFDATICTRQRELQVTCDILRCSRMWGK